MKCSLFQMAALLNRHPIPLTDVPRASVAFLGKGLSLLHLGPPTDKNASHTHSPLSFLGQVHHLPVILPTKQCCLYNMFGYFVGDAGSGGQVSDTTPHPQTSDVC
jgi:hypothetical protein